MPTTHLDATATIDKLMAVLDAGEILAETIRTFVSRSMRGQMLGRHYPMTRSDECLLHDSAEAWRECAENLEFDLSVIAAALSAAQCPTMR